MAEVAKVSQQTSALGYLIRLALSSFGRINKTQIMNYAAFAFSSDVAKNDTLLSQISNTDIDRYPVIFLLRK